MTCDKCVRLENCKYANEYVSRGIKVKETIHNCRDFKSVDLVEVVRCKDCEHSRICVDNHEVIQCILNSDYDEETGSDYGFLSYHSENHFCSYGEKVIK